MVKSLLGSAFSVKMPEVYQIEATNQCNFSCNACPRKYYDREDKTPFFDIELLRTMIIRGDLVGSYFIELQLSGEPLLHPELVTMIELIKNEGILVGLSTHGEFFPKKLETCKDLDYITISVDSITRRNEIRKGSKFDNPEDYLENLYQTVVYFIKRKIPIDLQFIELKGWEKERDILENYLKCRGMLQEKLLTIRSVSDCAILHRSGNRLKPSESNEIGICLNPFASVTVQSNGNVSPCCFGWGDGIIYGSLYKNSLQEIWEGKEVKRLRENHQKGFIYLPDICLHCYARSPYLLHWDIFLSSIKRRK